LTQRKRKQVREPLSDAAFNAHWRIGHVARLPLPNGRKRRRYFSSPWAIREVPNWSFWNILQAIHTLGVGGGAGWDGRASPKESRNRLWKNRGRRAAAKIRELTIYWSSGGCVVIQTADAKS
jgi:hypothetical protein